MLGRKFAYMGTRQGRLRLMKEVASHQLAGQGGGDQGKPGNHDRVLQQFALPEGATQHTSPLSGGSA